MGFEFSLISPDRNGLESFLFYGLDRVFIGLQRVGLDWIEISIFFLIRLYWIKLDRIGLE